MKRNVPLRRSALAGALYAAGLISASLHADARVTRIVIDTTASIAGQPLFEQVTGRAFGELDPNDAHNKLITDIAIAPRNANGNVEYIASFVLRKPIDMATASGVMWHDVPNRGGDVNFPGDSFAAMDTQLLSGWQGDNAGGTSVPANASCVPDSLGQYTPPCAKPAFAHNGVFGFAFDKRDYAGTLRTAEEVHAMSLANLDGEYAMIATTSELIATH